MAKVEVLYKDFYATCQCGSIEFNLRVDDVGDAWRHITGTECVGCGYQIDWIKVNNASPGEI